MDITMEIITIIGGILVCGGFWTFIQFLISRHDGKKQQIDKIQETILELQNTLSRLQEAIDQNNNDMVLQSEAIMAQAQDRIVWLARGYIKQGYIYDDDLFNMRKMADSYKALGGNGMVKTEMELVDTLPVKTRR